MSNKMPYKEGVTGNVTRKCDVAQGGRVTRVRGESVHHIGAKMASTVKPLGAFSTAMQSDRVSSDVYDRLTTTSKLYS